MALTETNKQPNDKTQKKIDQPKTSDGDSKTGKDGNYWSVTDVRGNGLILNQGEGHEFMKLKHGSDSSIELKPDGAVQFTSQNGQYSVVMGKNQMIITGANDVVVQGGGSLKVKGDYNLTVGGNANWAVENSFNLTAKNKNEVIRGNSDTIAQNKTEKITGTMSLHAETASIQSNKGLEMRSITDSIGVFGQNGVNLASEGGNITVAAKAGAFSVDSQSLVMQAAAAASIKAATLVLDAETSVTNDLKLGKKLYVKDDIHGNKNIKIKEEAYKPTNGTWFPGKPDEKEPGTAGSPSEPAAYKAATETIAI